MTLNLSDSIFREVINHVGQQGVTLNDLLVQLIQTGMNAPA